MSLTQITDHVARAMSRVITRLRGTEFEKLVAAIAGEVQVLEDALFSLFGVIRNPALASGAVLDKLGALVGAEVRGSHTDAEYRLRVAAAVARNVASAEPETVIAVVAALFPAMAGNIKFTDADVEGTGCAVVQSKTFESADGYVAITTAQAEELMRYLSRAAGTRVIFSYARPARSGAGSLMKFDAAGYGFDTGGAMSGSVDQHTRN